MLQWPVRVLQQASSVPICSTVAGMCTAAAGGRPLSTSIWPCYHACLVAQAAALMARHKRGRHECSDLLLPQQSGDMGSAAGSVIALKLDTNVQAVLICVILAHALSTASAYWHPMFCMQVCYTQASNKLFSEGCCSVVALYKATCVAKHCLNHAA